MSFEDDKVPKNLVFDGVTVIATNHLGLRVHAGRTFTGNFQ
jgi:hypothetical protein